MQDFRKLLVWQKSHALALSIYRATSPFPETERYGLTSQMRRASYSIPSNIAEGCGRSGRVELRQFLHVALGSASELDYFLLLARDLQFLAPPEYARLEHSVNEIKLMLAGLIRSLHPAKSSLEKPSKPAPYPLFLLAFACLPFLTLSPCTALLLAFYLFVSSFSCSSFSCSSFPGFLLFLNSLLRLFLVLSFLSAYNLQLITYNSPSSPRLKP